MDTIYCAECGRAVVHEGGQWVTDRACTSDDGHYVACTALVGVMVECGDPAVAEWDFGRAYCTVHHEHATKLDKWAERVEAGLE